MAIDKNAWFSGTEALKEEERKREDLILQGGLGAQKPKEATQKKAEAAENRPKVKTFRHFIEETASRQRAATEENMKKAEAAESQAKTQNFEEFLADFTAKQRAAGDNLKNVTAPAEVPKPSDRPNTSSGPAPALPQKTMGADLIQSAANSSGYSFLNANKTPVKADQLPSFPLDDSPRFEASQSDQRSESDTPQVECEAGFNTQVGFDGQVRHYLSGFDDTLRQDSTFMWIPEEPSQKTIVDFKLGIAPQTYGFLISSQVDLKKFPSQLRLIAQNGVRDLKNRTECISVKMMACLWNRLYLNTKLNGVSADVHQYQLELQMWTTYEVSIRKESLTCVITVLKLVTLGTFALKIVDGVIGALDFIDLKRSLWRAHVC
ncbi:hypothetical protein BELL_0838g00040 [Botrytis elliptica]|uniref:Uncharacterized protein n=1 Tax=Botrytis elliptica TaxID=278938 RepID=A0A4Z1J4X5_9HELO|nr:hypothetical protein BELL_0838g00040 [Botrytis elliptica]